MHSVIEIEDRYKRYNKKEENESWENEEITIAPNRNSVTRK